MKTVAILILLTAGCGSVDAARVSDAGGTGGAAGQVTVADSGAGGAAGAPEPDGGRRPLGAGCIDDTQCASGICGKASSTDTAGSCCDGRPDTCNTCVGGYITPVQDGTITTCAMCEGGKAVNLADGTACGTGPTGARPPSCNGLIGSDYRCSAGACIQGANVDCSTFTCASGSSPMCTPDNPAGTAQGVPVVQCQCSANTPSFD
jgi:hypothetical protein